jgi:2-C-methyl-D-erythritol 4-phosphate cytidylyltransferase
MPTTALIVAAGAGVRTGLPLPKAFLDLEGRPLVDYSLSAFDAHPAVDSIVLMAPGEMLAEAGRIAGRYPKVRAIAAGGVRRQDTVALGLERIAADDGGERDDALVLVHDAARPLVEASLISAVIAAAARTGAAIPGVTPPDTVREIEADGPGGARAASRTLDRRRVILVQTPQGFRLRLLRKAYEGAAGPDVTDDAALVERLGMPIETVEGSPRNLKITTAQDLIVAAALMRGAR